MDKYEFNLKVEQLNKLVKSGDYKAAMRITDTIDWSRVHNAGLLTTVSEVYEKNDEYKEAREILLLAYDRAPVGKRALYRLAMLAIKEGDIAEAQAYYNEYIEISPQDSRKYLMEYHIAVAKNENINKKIRILEKYCDIENMDEHWKYELAVLYAEAGRIDDCIKTCDEIMLLFGVGEYVEKAATLKESTGCPLSSKQQEQVDNKEYYEDRLNSLAKKYESGDRENYPNLNLDDMSAYKPREEKKTTIKLSDEDVTANDNAPISKELFPRAVGVNEARISETTFKGESVNPEFEVELKRAIEITNENLNKMKGENADSSMAEIDEEVRAHMEKVERIKHGRFISPPMMEERRKSRISNYFDGMGLPKTYVDRDEYRDMMETMKNTWISEDQEDKPAEREPETDEDEPAENESVPSEDKTDEPLVEKIYSDKDTSKDGTDAEGSQATEPPETLNNMDVEKKDESEDSTQDNTGEQTPTENIVVTQTASTKVLENYVPEKTVPTFDGDDFINSYDDEADTGVPTVSAVMAKIREQRDLVKSSVKSETKVEVADDEEIYYTKEERTFVTKVKKGDTPGEIIVEPEFKAIENDEETPVTEDNTKSDMEDKAKSDTEDKSESDIEEDDYKEGDTVVIEESEDEESGEVDLPVQEKVMKDAVTKSREPKEMIRRPGSIMVEGATAQKALEKAKEVLREVNEHTKIANSALKIGALSLNKRGVMNSIDKIKGKDLIIVDAGKLDDNTIAELVDFINYQNGKGVIVFADTVSGISSLQEANVDLNRMSIKVPEEEVPVKRKNFVANIVLKEKDSEKDLKEAKEQKDTEETENKKTENKEISNKDTGNKETDNKEESEDSIADILRKALGMEGIQFESIQEIGSSDTIREYKPSDEASGEDYKENRQNIKLEPVISKPITGYSVKPEGQPVKVEKQTVESDKRPAIFDNPIIKPIKQSAGEATDANSDDNVPMGVDEFIKYTLNYVKEIECSLSYKTEYAIEERADYMKQDGTPLTRKNARNMVEHAADLAEKPGVMKTLFGFMNAKYDKEGRLILREEHFKI